MSKWAVIGHDRYEWTNGQLVDTIGAPVDINHMVRMVGIPDNLIQTGLATHREIVPNDETAIYHLAVAYFTAMSGGTPPTTEGRPPRQDEGEPEPGGDVDPVRAVVDQLVEDGVLTPEQADAVAAYDID
jgi:hypothetical protein